MHILRRFVLVSVTLAAAGCGGGGDGGGVTPPGNQTLNSITLDRAAVTLIVGQRSPLVAQAFDAAGARITASGFTFTSSDETKVTVSATGELLGVALGNSTITASLTRDGVTKTATATASVVAGTFPSQAQVVANATSDTFSPNVIDIVRGGTVTFKFLTVVHDVIFTAPGAPQNIPQTQNRDVERTFDTAGTFAYDCTLHAGMSGRVIVH